MDIAIIGLSLRLPNEINNLEHLYDRLKNKTDCISEHPVDRFHMESFYDEANSIGKMNTKRAGYIKDVYDFDNGFFKISNKEARTTDPQQRIMLELVYEALQNSRISLDECKNSNTGVYMGSCNTEYFSKQTEDAEWCNDYSLPGGLLTLLSNRISYFYDFKGPSMTLDTACSSSGHALHLACQSLTSGETDMCIVGGSNLLLNPETTIGFSQGKFLAPDGKCKAFDEAANGYVRSEGCVVFVLERLEEAIEKKRDIRAVIKKTAVNQDGKTDSITMPNGDLQMELLQQIYEGVNLDDITYIEAHGTGTKVGDKIETNSIGTVLGKQRNAVLPIGSVKSAIGHTEATSGLAALCKIILMMEKRELLPNQHFHVPSSNIDFKTLNLEVVTETVPITKERILMGVNNYGFGGSNFHCLLENYIVPEDEIEIDEVEEEGLGLHLLCVTGNDEEAIDKNVMPYILHENSDFLKYVYNQNCSTDLFEEAKMYIVENQQDFQSQILNPDKVKDLSVVYGKRNVLGEPNICFVFCGQGPQFLDMGRDYVKRFPVFRDKILECDNHWKRISGYSFLAEYGLFTENTQADVPISDPIVAQPAIAFFQIALFHLYESFGIVPNTVIGHSAGEQAAFYASGALTLEDTIKISYYRSIYQQQTAGLGNMLVINQNIETIDTLLEANPALELAVVNSNTSYVFSGPTEAIDLLKKQLTEDGISAIKIAGRCPFHSSLQESIKEKILTSTRDIVCHEPNIELISTVTGYSFQKEDYTPDYWWNNIRNVVRFYEGIEQSDADVFIEIAPHIVLTSNIQIVHKEALVLHSAHRKEDSARRFLSTLAKLYLCGAPVDMSLFGIENTTHYPLYQWNKKLHFQEPTSSHNRRHNIVQKLNTIRFSPNKYPYVKDHIIGGKPILPTVTYIDLIRTYIMTNENRIENLTIHSMYDITSDDVEFMVDQTGNTYTFMSLDNKTKYLSFSLSNLSNETDDNNAVDFDFDFNLLLKSPTVLEKSDLIEILKTKNYNFGNKMFAFKRAYLGDVFKNDILIEIDEKVRVDLIYPTVLDICLTSNMMIPLQGITNHYQYLPTSIEECTFHSVGRAKYVYTCGAFDSKKHYICHSYILSDEFKLLISFENIKSINVSNTNTQIYTPIRTPVELQEVDDTLKYENIDTSDLLKIRDTLFENKEVIYLMDIEVNYEVIGFVRSLLNEIKEVKFKVCYYRLRIDDVINTLKICPWTDIEYFYEENRFTEIKLEKATPHFELPDYYLHYTNKGSLQNLKYMYKSSTALKTGEVRVKIHASALNFKDIAVMFDLVKDTTIGYEFSGTVEESLSPQFRPGDRIFGTNTDTGNCIGNTVISPDKYIWHTPDDLDDVTAAGFSLSFGTAYLALIEYGRVKREDVVLIHSATGALGLAAIEICKTIGCRVIATAGTEEKRAYLRQFSNVDFVTDSRSHTTYLTDILEYTNGKGVDVVLAATIGEAMSTNIKLLKPRGKYLDVGKKLIYEKGGLPLENFLKSIQYHSVHFDELLRTENAYIRTIVNRVCDLVTTGQVSMFPIIKTSMANIKHTFTEFSKSNHTGKYVCVCEEDFRPEPTECLFPAKIFNQEDYYLITGGLGGLGLQLMCWMKQYGAQRFLVTSRQTLTEKMRAFLKTKQLDVTVIQTDLLDYETLDRQLKPYKIDGVFHLAGMIKDKMAKMLNPEDLAEIINVKKYGLENLGRIFSEGSTHSTRSHSYFVAFSSIVALIGNPGQSTYAAANSYMDEYCQRRKLKGLPALSINLGAIGGCGMICTDFQLGRTMMANGINFTVYHDLFDQMKEVLLDKNLAQVCITDQDWNSLSNLKTKPLFRNFLKMDDDLEDVNTTEEQGAINEKKIIDFLNGLLDTKTIDTEKNLISYGVDSIMSMEIANWCRDHLNIPIKQIDILQGITIREILKKTKAGKEHGVKKTTEHNANNKFIFNLKSRVHIEQPENEQSSSSSWYGLAYILSGMIVASTYYFMFEN